MWSIEREMEDRITGERGTYRGTAVFAHVDDDADPGTVQHAENGEMTWRGVTRPAGRVLHLHPREDGTARVTFADGRPFHDLDLREGRWTAGHPCRADQYSGAFEVLGPDGWQVTWTVTGPAKDLVLTSFYTRIRH
ncbi:hypothetical protein BIV57_06030 [Mangrovactinospora gilvigrisea]|uniref:DUF6314 domain-containing protein n=2 Tax=Mangrovactinospora gilvigrisea TaxID=1428644 RepID=A0A1J7BIA9_9ACTN|nr:hypothetical protein BIV57_06030 [Mangrovactinospora gilvigrisea]